MGAFQSNIAPAESSGLVHGLRIVMISDTHNEHKDVNVPNGDVLIHAGDYTRYGKLEDAVAFNDWLGTLSHRYKFVVNGNHEYNAPWKAEVRNIISNAVVLIDESAHISTPAGTDLVIYGVNFTWPVRGDENPLYTKIPSDVDILVCHGPAKGYVDGDKGCHLLTKRCEELILHQNSKLKLVVSGHIHLAYGQCCGSRSSKFSHVRFVNAAIAAGEGVPGHSPIVMDI